MIYGLDENRAVLTKVRAANAEQMCTNCIINAWSKLRAGETGAGGAAPVPLF